jgi:aspartate 1-decarboxylase
VHRGDTIIVISYAAYTREEMEHYEPRVVHVDRDNDIIAADDQVATLLTSV